MSLGSEVLVDFVAGWFGGLANIFAGHPFDTVKVRMQTSAAGSRNASAIRCALETFRNEGVHGFYKGMAFPLVSVGAMNSILFGVYGNMLKVMSGGGSASATPPPPPTYGSIYLAGCVAGAVQLSVACPTELVKTKLQVQTVGYGSGQALYAGPIDCVRSLLKTGGLRSCYHGLAVTALRDIPATGLYILTYEYLCDAISGARGAVAPSPLTAIVAGGMAGVISWGSIIPFDVVKSRIQSDSHTNRRYTGILHCVRDSYQKEGFRVFFRGFLVISVRAFPTNACIFLVYSYSLDKMKRMIST